MSEYRDELAAAHARIAELEDKVHALEAEIVSLTTPKHSSVELLELEVARLRAQSIESSGSRVGLMVGVVVVAAGVSFLLVDGWRTRAMLPFAVCTAVVLLRTLMQHHKHRAARRALLEAEQRLAEARRETSSTEDGPRLRVTTQDERDDVEEEVVEAAAGTARRASS